VNALDRERARFEQALSQIRCVGPGDSAVSAAEAVDWLAERAREVRARSGSVFFIGAGAGDPQSHHFAAAFHRRMGIRGIALGESPFRDAEGEGARAAEKLAHWFARPGDLVVHLFDTTATERLQAIMNGASSLGLRTVAFTRWNVDAPPIPTAELNLFIPAPDVHTSDCVQHFLVNTWLSSI